MRLHPVINPRNVFFALCGAGLALGALSFHARADEWDKRTILTVNQPIQVKDTLLEPGQYVFKLLNSPSERHVVQIFNSDQSHIITTVLAIPNYRLEPTGNSRFQFWETPPGYAKALRAWFYPGDNFGQEFPYPKHLKPVETASVTAPPPLPTAAPSQPAPPPEPESVATPPAQEQPEAEQPAEVAQSTPPPAAAPQPPAEQTPAPASQPESLPKTGSLYPLFGLAGVLSLGIYGLLRMHRPKQEE
ncbi:MAG TPA: LPXTG cell wall anchor domain-containing protein [Candidatus Sulfopaludibacter sp.]|nr:LPXTG cell wall anchor domain-containing protein [Candidatus Sulfopaludibacter sp.]